jgi:hypothetical protein
MDREKDSLVIKVSMARPWARRGLAEALDRGWGV